MALEVSKIEVEVTWKKQTIEEVISDNSLYFLGLRRLLSMQDAERAMRTFVDGLTKQLEVLPDTISEKVPMLQIGRGITFWPFFSDIKSVRHPQDPINVVFWNYASSGTLSHALTNLIGGWNPTTGATMYVLIDDSRHGGPIAWKKFDSQLRKGNFFGRSQHVRIYEGFNFCSHGKGQYSIAGVHEETFLPVPHTVIDWDNAQADLELDFKAIAPRLTGSIQTVNLGNSGNYHSIPNSGVASYVEIQRPSWLVTI